MSTFYQVLILLLLFYRICYSMLQIITDIWYLMFSEAFEEFVDMTAAQHELHAKARKLCVGICSNLVAAQSMQDGHVNGREGSSHNTSPLSSHDVNMRIVPHVSISPQPGSEHCQFISVTGILFLGRKSILKNPRKMSSQLQHDKTPSPRSLVPDGALKLVCYDANDEYDIS